MGAAAVAPGAPGTTAGVTAGATPARRGSTSGGVAGIRPLIPRPLNRSLTEF